MVLLGHFMIVASIFAILSLHGHGANSFGSLNFSSRALDSLLQGYGYRAFGRHPRTGRIYSGSAPTNLTGIQISVLRLRSGSLRNRGVASFKEFTIPVGVIVHPYVERLVLVYQNLGNWTSFYFPLPGYSYIAPMLGLFAYNASNLSALNLPILDFEALGSQPIMIKFQNLSSLVFRETPMCVTFDPSGSPAFSELVSGGICSTLQQGHFSIVVNSTGFAPPPAPRKSHRPAPMRVSHKSHNVWKIVGGVVGGIVGLVLLSSLLFWMRSYRLEKKLTSLRRNADEGEELRTKQVGNAQLPAALTTRTLPILENEYVT